MKFADMNPEQQRAYASGMSNAYKAVLCAFGAEFEKRPAATPVDAHAVFAHVQKQVGDVQALLAAVGLPQ